MTSGRHFDFFKGQFINSSLIQKNPVGLSSVEHKSLHAATHEYKQILTMCFSLVFLFYTVWFSVLHLWFSAVGSCLGFSHWICPSEAITLHLRSPPMSLSIMAARLASSVTAGRLLKDGLLFFGSRFDRRSMTNDSTEVNDSIRGTLWIINLWLMDSVYICIDLCYQNKSLDNFRRQKWTNKRILVKAQLSLVVNICLFMAPNRI